MASHSCWAAALFIAIRTGRAYAANDLAEFGGIGGLCDAAFSNGVNGPFGYGYNRGASRAIDGLLVSGSCIALTLAVWSVRKRAYGAAVVNVVIGVLGGVLAIGAHVSQISRNPYCTPHGWWRDGIVAVGLVVTAAAVNLFVARRSATVAANPGHSRPAH